VFIENEKNVEIIGSFWLFWGLRGQQMAAKYIKT